jgi:Cytochrome P450
MHRRALNNFTLQDGTFIPKNTTVCAALFATHRDERNYANPNNFDGFRFVHTASWPLSEGENVNQKMVRGSLHARHDDICLMYFFDHRLLPLPLTSHSVTVYIHGETISLTSQFIIPDFCLSSPGRFFAAIELKAMMAHLVLNYDVKLENEGVRPPDIWLGGYCIPNQKANVLFRKRQA